MAIATLPDREPGEERGVLVRWVLPALLLIVLGLFVYSLVSAYA